MCGIAGVWRKDKTVEPSTLKSMTDTIKHRGPDGEGYWISNNKCVGLGHRRLSIIDLSDNGSQPMVSQDSRFSITFNGEIYNYLELREKLIDEGFLFRTETDTEVLLMMFQRYGIDCLSYLDGMFAFAIWDEEQQSLFCARDRVGEKPFFYTWDGESFSFASEIKALRSVYKYEIDLGKLQGFIDSGQIDSYKQTFFKGVHQLGSASYLTISKSGELSVKKYWEIDLDKKNDLNYEESTLKFKKLFVDSVKKRMRMDVAYGTSLSGGLDSSAIASVIAQELKTPLETFSARFEGKLDEGNWMNHVIQKHKVKNFQVYPNFEHLTKELDQVSFHQEYPVPGSSMYAQWCVMKLVNENNVTVLIDGQGADEYLCGYKEFKYFAIWDLFYDLQFSDFFKERKYFNQLFMPQERLGWGFVFYPLLKVLGMPPKEWAFASNLKSRLKYSVENDLGNLLLSADRNSMAHSIETRLPFTDHKLIEFTFTLDSKRLYKSGMTKNILRESMSQILPKEIIERTDKVGFAPPQNEWMKNEEGVEEIRKANDLIQSFSLVPNSKFPWRNIAAASFLRAFT